MKYAWLEKYAEDGLISKESLDSIYKDVDSIVKSADAKNYAKELMDSLLKGLSAAVGAGAVAGGVKKFEEMQGRSAIEKSRLAVLSDQVFSSNKQKASQRFNEIASIAPHVAMNQPLVKKIILSNLENGLTEDTVQSLAIVQAQHMPEVLRNKNFMPKMASVSPEKLGEIAADVYLIKEAAAVGFSPKINETLKNIAMHTAIPLLIGVGGGAVNAILSKINQKNMKAELEKSFEKAVALSHKDNEPLHENKEKARQAFQSLAHFAPHVALEPQAARAFMTKVVSYDQGMHIDDIRALSEVQKNMAGSSKASPFALGFEHAGRFTNMPGTMQKAVESAGDELIHKMNQGHF